MITSTISIQGVEVTVLHKAIKNIYIRIYPPDGRVTLSLPLGAPDEVLYSFLNRRLGWIKKQQARMLSTPPKPLPQAITGEKVLLFGQAYRLECYERSGRHEVITKDQRAILYTRPGTSAKNRLKVLDEWQRTALKKNSVPYLEQWQKVLGVEIQSWVVRRMKRRWGSCSVHHKQIILNLNLAKKPLACLEYVVVHELIHLLEWHHTKRFYNLLDQYLPDWRERSQLLNG